MYDAILGDSLRDNVHFMSVYDNIDNIYNCNIRLNEFKALAGPNGLWTSDIFYMNHYYGGRSAIYDYDDVA